MKISNLPVVVSPSPTDYLVGDFGSAPTTSKISLLTLKNALTLAGLSYADTGVLASWSSSVNSYTQVVIQNTNSGAAASTNYNVSNDAATASTNFAEFGINSSGFSGVGSFNRAGAAYLASASTDLVIGTYGSNTLRFVTNSASSDAAVITPNNILIVAPAAASAGGSTSAYLGISAVTGLGVYFGSGAPTIAAAQGSLYIRTDGSSTSTRLYVNTSSSTTWTNVTTAA